MKLLLLIGVFLITSHVVSTCPARAAMSNFNTTRTNRTIPLESASYISFPGALNKMDAASHEAKFNLVRYGVTWLSSRFKTLNATYEAEADQVLPSGDYLASDQSGCP
uniref:Uncharacterized protein n=1 Tax=Timema bartmani TaxID=61472 RepID=A0A7R9I2S5_9NEOP|nr:unnamed protein product [Timema bartmani]